MCFTCDLTVSGAIASSRAMALLESPSAISLWILSSRAVRASAPAEFVDAPAAGPWARRRRSGSRSRRARGGGILPSVRRLVKLRQQRVQLRSLIKDDLADTVFRGHCRDGGKFVWAIRDLPRTPRQYRQVRRYPGCQVAAACALAFLPQVLQEGTRLIQAVLRRGEIGPRQKGVAMNVGPGAARGYGILRRQPLEPVEAGCSSLNSSFIEIEARPFHDCSRG